MNNRHFGGRSSETASPHRHEQQTADCGDAEENHENARSAYLNPVPGREKNNTGNKEKGKQERKDDSKQGTGSMISDDEVIKHL
jgi:hypothetical protein